jgi:hypothetical protein
MAAGYLIDTSAAIKYLNQTLPANGAAFIDRFINTDCTISFISQIELQVWNPVDPNDILVYQEFVNRSNVVGITSSIISETVFNQKSL